jgi:hypothetical protein
MCEKDDEDFASIEEEWVESLFNTFSEGPLDAGTSEIWPVVPDSD